MHTSNLYIYSKILAWLLWPHYNWYPHPDIRFDHCVPWPPFIGYTRGQSSSVSPRGYGSNGSTPHSSNGSSYGSTAAVNGYPASSLSMGMTAASNDFLSASSTSEQLNHLNIIKSEAYWVSFLVCALYICPVSYLCTPCCVFTLCTNSCISIP